MKKVAILLTDKFADWEYGLLSGTGGPFYGLNIQFFAPKKGSITSQGGLTVSIENSFDETPLCKPDAIAVIGGMIWETDAAPDISDQLQNAHESGVVIAGICGGTLALARSGILNDIPHTSNDLEFLERNADNYAGELHFIQSPSAVSHNNTITSPGTAPVSFTASLYEKLGLDKSVIDQFKTMMKAEHI